MTISATDTESGVDKIEYSVDGQPCALYTEPLVVNQPGARTVRYRATDKAGNISDVGTARCSVITPCSGKKCR